MKSFVRTSLRVFVYGSLFMGILTADAFKFPCACGAEHEIPEADYLKASIFVCPKCGKSPSKLLQEKLEYLLFTPEVYLMIEIFTCLCENNKEKINVSGDAFLDKLRTRFLEKQARSSSKRELLIIPDSASDALSHYNYKKGRDAEFNEILSELEPMLQQCILNETDVDQVVAVLIQ